MLEIKADKNSYLRIKEQLKLIQLDKRSRSRINGVLGRYITKKTKQDIRAQRDPEGRKWKARKKGRKKMHKGFIKKLKYFQRDNNRTLFIGWPTRRGYVAAKHHYGTVEKSGLQQRFNQAKRNKEPKKSDPATKEQAKELRALGYRLPKQGRQKRGKKPTLKFIRANMTVAEVAKLISELESKVPARKWDVRQPERRLIGISPKRVAMIIKREMKRNRSK